MTNNLTSNQLDDRYLNQLAISFTEPAERIGCNYHFTKEGMLGLLRNVLSQARSAPEPPARHPMLDVVEICDAYESGIGQGLKNRPMGENRNPYDPVTSPHAYRAYGIGYDEGAKRAALPPSDALITLSMTVGSDKLAAMSPNMADYRKMLLKMIQELIDRGTPTKSEPWIEPAKHCQNGGDVCLAGNKDGTCCPDDSCDIDDGMTSRDPRRASAETSKPLDMRGQPFGDPHPIDLVCNRQCPICGGIDACKPGCEDGSEHL